MLSSGVNSKRDIDVNSAIMRIFVRVRRILDSHAKLAKKPAGLEDKYDEQFRIVFEVLNELMAAPEPKRKPIGFSVKERRVRYSAQNYKS